MLKRAMLLWFMVLFAVPVWAEGEEKEGEAAVEDYVNYIQLKPFIANFGEKGKLRFLKCEITIQVNSESAHHAVNAHMAHIRNDLVFLLTDQTEATLKTVEAQQTLAKEALKKVQDLLVEEEGEAFVNDLFFTSLVIQ